MRKYRNPRQSLYHWLLTVKPGECIEFIAQDFGLNKNTLEVYLRDISRDHFGYRLGIRSTGPDSMGVRRLVDAEVANG